jgi:2'-5' RNA ligase
MFPKAARFATTCSTACAVGEFVHDERHRFSYELRPDADLDRRLRELAVELEADGLLPPGAAAAPRFHPHITFVRADHADTALVEDIARRIAHDPELVLDTVGTFGGGRIAWLAPSRDLLLRATRVHVVDALGGEAHVDPLALRRDPWTPHVTVAYSIDEPHRDAVHARLAAALPIHGRWIVAQTWDLDVRPTRLVHEAAIS